ncbi:MAG: putative sulfate exporter family transporter [Parasphingorhabdus sp.]|uniref:YeiH family protein n=1 Tax=Parasphingorhabdus sp. TaxID=2709688 RepID=UPI003296E196
MSHPDRELPLVADLYGELQLAEPSQKRTVLSHFPGFALVGIVSLAALWLSEHYGPPAILMGLLLGLAMSFVNADKRLSTGLDFSSQTLLRIGIVLIGMRISFNEITSLGIAPFISLIAIMVVVIGTGIVAARLFKLDPLFGLLAGGATAICGASAALALWSIIGTKRIDQSRFTIVLLGTTVASAFAMTFYPSIAGFLGLSDKQAGFLIGASIHDVAQAIGGGFSYSPEAGEVATVVKLSRVTLLAPLLIIIAMIMQKMAVKDTDSTTPKIGLRQGLPWFIVGFIALITINSMFQLPPAFVEFGNKLASMLLLFAVVAAAIKSNLGGLMSHGWHCFVPVVMTTAMAFLLSMLAIQFL